MMNTFLQKYDLTYESVYGKQLEIQRAIQNGEMEPYEDEWLPNLIREFMNELIEKGKSPGYARQITTHMRFFFKSSRIDFQMDRGDIPRGESIGKSVASHEQIREMWDRCTKEFKLRNRALIAFMKDSGLRPIDISGLNVVDYLRAVNESSFPGFAKFRPVITSKAGKKAYPRIGPETVEAMNRYLNGRTSGPLFLAKEMIPGTKRPKKELKRMNSMDISSIFSNLTETMESGDTLGAYSLRKFHSTTLNAPRADLGLPAMSEAYIAILQGKEHPGTFGPYNQPWQTGKLMEEYMRHYPKLSLFDSSSQEQLEALNLKLRNLEEEVQGIDELREKITDLEAALGLIHTREGWDTATTLEEARKRRARDSTK
jgi:integrase